MLNLFHCHVHFLSPSLNEICSIVNKECHQYWISTMNASKIYQVVHSQKKLECSQLRSLQCSMKVLKSKNSTKPRKWSFFLFCGHMQELENSTYDFLLPPNELKINNFKPH